MARRRENLIDKMLEVNDALWKKRRFRMLDEVTRIEELLRIWPLTEKLEEYCASKPRPTKPKRRDVVYNADNKFWWRRRANFLSEIDNIERMTGRTPRLAELRRRWNGGGG